MVSQGAQTNNGINNRKLTKSLSEVVTRTSTTNADTGIQTDDLKLYIFFCSNLPPINCNFICYSSCEHELLHRTQSEEPPRSPFETNAFTTKSKFYDFEQQSGASSRQSDLETSKSDIFSMDSKQTHSRNLSQDSAVSFRSIDVSVAKESMGSVVSCASSSHVLDENNESYGQEDMGSGYDRRYETNSLPRQKYEHKKQHFHTYSLPRKDPHKYHQQIYDSPAENINRGNITNSSTLSRKKLNEPNRKIDLNIDRPYVNVISQKRPSYPNIMASEPHIVPVRRSSYHSSIIDHETTSETDCCSTCESENDSKQEKEIFIDFKPRISPIPSPRSKKKRLQKTLSEGEILFEKRREEINDVVVPQMGSASEEDLKTPEEPTKSNYFYRNAPIKDEGIFVKNHLLKLPINEETSLRNRREAFRKRSISLEDPTIEENISNQVFTPIKSAPPSPCPDELSTKGHSDFPSTDSLSNDLTRDHSDGIWNESQATVVSSTFDAAGPNTITPSAKRKNLLLQHLQRSSMDTEALEMEDHFIDQV